MISGLTTSVNQIHERLGKLEGTISSLSGDVSHLQVAVSEVTRDVTHHDTVLDRILDTIHSSEIESVKDKAIITGYPVELPPNDRVSHFSSLSDIPKDRITAKNKSLQVKFPSVEEKKNFIKKFKEKRPTMSHSGKTYPIYVSPARTSVQNMKDAELRKAMRYVKNESPTSSVSINYSTRQVLRDGVPALQQNKVGKISHTSPMSE